MTTLTDSPLAITSKPNPGDKLILVLRSIVWSEKAVNDLQKALDDACVGYVILYLDGSDEAHVVRA